MDYVEMIKDPELVLGFQELISDSDSVVVKRTVKVFTSVYHHTLRLLSSGELDEETLLKSWTSVNGVVDSLLGMIKNCENEGILMHLLRFLESAVMSHLMYDLTCFPIVFERGREVIKTGLKGLKDLVTTPYIGGSCFIVGIKALITIACLRPDLWEPVTDLIKKQLSSLPPTLFDHNVRSLNKTLQRNLFRLLRRAEKPELKQKLIEMMVSVGVPRKMIAPWAPQITGMRKRSPPVDDRSYIWNNLPPDKKSRLELEDGEKGKRSRSNTPEVPIDPRFQRSRSNTPEVPTDPRFPLKDPRTAVADEEPYVPQPPAEKKADNAHLLFLTSLIPTGKMPSNTSSEDTVNMPSNTISEDTVNMPSNTISEDTVNNKLYELLNLENVCKLVIQNIDYLPDMESKDFITSMKNLGSTAADSETIRKRLAPILDTYLNDHKNSLSQTNNNRRPNSPQHKSELTHNKILTQSYNDITVNDSSSNSVTSTPSSTPPLADTDLRQVFPRPSASMGDVDMRISDPRLASRDPRLIKDPRTRKDVADPRANYPQTREVRVDPRLDNKGIEHKSRIDPRTVENKSRPDPRNVDIVAGIDTRNIDNVGRIDTRNIDNGGRIDSRNIDNGSRIDIRNIDNGGRIDPRNIDNSARINPRNIDNSARIDPRNIDNSARTDPRNIANSTRIDHIYNGTNIDPRNLDNSTRIDPRNIDNSKRIDHIYNGTRIDPRNIDNSTKIDHIYNGTRIDPRNIDNSTKIDHIYNGTRIDPRNIDNSMGMDPRNVDNGAWIDSRNIDNVARIDPRLSSANPSRKTVEPRKTRWDPRTPQEIAKPPSPGTNTEFPTRPNDLRIGRNLGQGLLPHPDPRTFQRDMNPRLQFRNQEPRMPSNFAPQGPFPFGPTNNLNRFNNPFINNLGMSQNPNAMPQMINGTPPFGWDSKNNIRNTNPSLLLAQTLASVQQGLLPPSIINL